MLAQAGYNQYANNKIMTASPAELTLMLYEGAIKFTNIAIVAMEKSDYAKASLNINKVDRILEEFQVTLNHKYAVAADFDRIYTYLRDRLLLAHVRKDPEMLNEVLEQLRGMRDTWKEVMRLTKNGTVVA